MSSNSASQSRSRIPRRNRRRPKGSRGSRIPKRRHRSSRSDEILPRCPEHLRRRKPLISIESEYEEVDDESAPPCPRAPDNVCICLCECRTTYVEIPPPV